MTVVTSVLATRTWAIYSRSRRILLALISGFVACFLPSFTVFFLSYTSNNSRSGDGLTEMDNDWLNSVVQVHGWIEAGGEGTGYGGMGADWVLTRCFHPGTARLLGWVILSSLVYESEFARAASVFVPA